MSVRKPAWAAAVAALVCLAPPAPAQVVYQFARDDGTPQATFAVVQGQTVNIRLYLFDGAAGAPTLSANAGLGSAGVRVTSGTPAVAGVVNPATDALPAVPPWTFGTTGGSAPPASAVLNLAGPLSGATGVLPTAGRVLLGVFRFTGVAVGSATLTAADPNPTVGGDTTWFNNPTPGVPTGQNLDNPGSSLIANATATLTVTPVPEPTSLALAGLAAAALAVARRRRTAGTPAPAA